MIFFQTMVVPLTHILCQSEKHFTNPGEFLPERWMRQEGFKTRLHPHVMLPYGYGPRTCLGKRIAQQEICIIAAKVILLLGYHRITPS